MPGRYFLIIWLHGFTRILRKLPAPPEEGKISFSHLLIAMFRSRADKVFLNSLVFNRVLRRLVHLFCQNVELSLERHLTSKCPKDYKSSLPHPHSKTSRLKGNKSLQMSVIERFQTRTSGFVSAKEMSLHEVGIRDSRKYGSRTTAEYCCRLLAKGVEFMMKYDQEHEWKTINCCFDMATVSHESVLRKNISLNILCISNSPGFE